MSIFAKIFHKIEIEGVMPERALLRLKRVGVPLYAVKKTAKNRLTLRLRKGDLERAFALFPNAKTDGFAPYKLTDFGAAGLGGKIEKLAQRTGLLLGGLLFAITTLYADRFVFSVEYVGTSVYARETRIALEQAGVKLFAPYEGGKEDLICAQILALDGVEYCSVKKSGGKLIVETRLSPFANEYAKAGNMQSKHSGELVALTVLRGTAVAKIGESVQIGQTLVDDHFFVEGGGQVRVEIIARARFLCVWEGEIDVETEEEAFATAYLEIGENTEITQREIMKNGNGFHVKLVYTATQSMNF